MQTVRIVLVFLALSIAVISAGLVRDQRSDIPSAINGEFAIDLISLYRSVRCSSGTEEVEQISRREDCDCVTSGGRCMHTGDYQCYFSGGASIVQCNLAGKWTLLSKCDNTCKTLHNDRPYCL